MFVNELDSNGNPICSVCNKPVMPNGTLPVDSLDRGTGAFTKSGAVAIIHKSCAQALDL
jgi:hypothetical protein